MVATLLKLKFTLVKNSLRRSTMQLVMTILGAVYGLGLLVVLTGSAIAAAVSDVSVSDRHLIEVLAGALVVLAWTLLPLLLYGSDETLDPRRFVTFSIPRRQLTFGLLLSGFIGLPGALTMASAIILSLMWVTTPAALVAGLVAGVLGALTCLALSRLVTTFASHGLTSRKGKDASSAIGLILVVAMAPLFALLGPMFESLSNGEGVDSITDTLGSIAQWLAWTPLGAAWSIPGDIAASSWLLALGHLLAALAWLGLIVWGWSTLLVRAMISPTGGSSGAKDRTSNGIARIVSRSWVRPAWVPTFAVVGRCLRYWRTDPRYSMMVVTVPLFPIIAIILSRVGDMPGAIVMFSVPFSAWITGYSISNDIGSDSTAFWTHVSTGLSGRADRAGRAIAMSVLAVPTLIVLAVVTCFIAGEPDRILTIVSLTVGVFGASIAVSMVGSALLTYPIARPWENPMTTKTGSTGITMLSQFGAMGASLVLSLPVVGVSLAAYFGPSWWQWVALVIGFIGGAAIAWAGVMIGGRTLDRREVALLAQVVRADT